MKSTFRKWSFLSGSIILLLTITNSCQSKSESYKKSLAKYHIPTPIHTEQTVDGNYQIIKVSDGDTFWCKNSIGQKIKVRLIGIDAPEARNYFHKKKQFFRKEASKYATELLLHQNIKLEFDVDSLDQYGRTLAYAYLNDGTFINEKIVKDGYAILMTVAPNIKYEDQFVKAQHHAREKKLGLWGKNNIE